LNFIGISVVVTLFLTMVGPLNAAGPEEKLARKSGCFKCHAIDKEKDGPTYKAIAEKYNKEADGATKMLEHLTSEPTVEVKGKEQKHKMLKTDDEAEIKAVIQWILAQ
jgi:cytochrome c